MNLQPRSNGTTNLDLGHYLGQINCQISRSVGLVTETSYRSEMAIREHTHQEAYLCLIVDGACRERTDLGAKTCETGTVVFHPKGMPHEVHFGSEGGRCLNIELSHNWMQLYAGPLMAEASSRYSLTPLDPMLLRRLREEMALADTYTDMAVTGIILEILAKLLREPEAELNSSAPCWMKFALAYLDNQGTPPSLERLAEECSLHPSYLARAFRRYQGMSVGEYSRRKRLHRACRQLVETNQSIAQIALEQGFADQSHLTRVMRRALGITPASYRRRS